jgi:deoxyribodipyrimidine photo-lyase
VQVESDVVVPVGTASSKEEYSAATLRPKIRGFLRKFLAPMRKSISKIRSLGIHAESFDVENVDKALSRLDIDRSVKPVVGFRGGTQEAKRHLETFLTRKLKHYQKLKNDPTQDVLSNMSPTYTLGRSPLFTSL